MAVDFDRPPTRVEAGGRRGLHPGAAGEIIAFLFPEKGVIP